MGFYYHLIPVKILIYKVLRTIKLRLNHIYIIMAGAIIKHLEDLRMNSAVCWHLTFKGIIYFMVIVFIYHEFDNKKCHWDCFNEIISWLL